nr:MAG TPA: hypothetical protein [Caudoviricetes sp.]
MNIGFHDFCFRLPENVGRILESDKSCDLSENVGYKYPAYACCIILIFKENPVF